MTEPFISYAQNAEDVVLWRALGHIPNGRYVDVGANDPVQDSVTKAFYDRGWRGVHVEPVPYFADLLREQRPDDTVVEAAMTDADADEVVLHEVENTGLSTLQGEVGAAHRSKGFSVKEITVPALPMREVVSRNDLTTGDVHFLKIDVEGAEAAVLRSSDFMSWRPWIVVVEATEPNTEHQTHEAWEGILDKSGYRFCLFDGLSRFYVAEEHADLAQRLDHGACVFDDYRPAWAVRAEEQSAATAALLEQQRSENAALRHDLVRWRTAAVESWARHVMPVTGAPGGSEADELRREVEELRATVSWRVTAPLRAARRLRTGAGR